MQDYSKYDEVYVDTDDCHRGFVQDHRVAMSFEVKSKTNFNFQQNSSRQWGRRDSPGPSVHSVTFTGDKV